MNEFVFDLFRDIYTFTEVTPKISVVRTPLVIIFILFKNMIIIVISS